MSKSPTTTDPAASDASSNDAKAKATDAKVTSAKTQDTNAGAEASPALPPDLPARVEAALLTTDRALTAAKLAEALGGDGGGDEGGVTAKAITEAIDQLNAAYEQTGRSFRIEAVADGWKVMTLPQYAGVLAALHKTRSQSKLSPAALETLAIIAYKQPVLRAEIEAIRGAASGEVIRSLLERHLIKIVGRAEEIGRPMLYGTTRTFLEVFGLSSLKDLPQVEQLKPKQ